MVTFTCNEKGCANDKVVYNFLGNPETAECGGCCSILVAQDLRDDPPHKPVKIVLPLNEDVLPILNIENEPTPVKKVTTKTTIQKEVTE